MVAGVNGGLGEVDGYGGAGEVEAVAKLRLEDGGVEVHVATGGRDGVDSA